MYESVSTDKPSRSESIRGGGVGDLYPRGSIYTTIMELGPPNHNMDGLLGPNSTMVVYMDPVGTTHRFLTEPWEILWPALRSSCDYIG